MLPTFKQINVVDDGENAPCVLASVAMTSCICKFELRLRLRLRKRFNDSLNVHSYVRQLNLPLAGVRPCLFRMPEKFWHRSSLILCCTSELSHHWCRSKSITRTSTKVMETPKVWCCAWSKPMRCIHIYTCDDVLYYCIRLYKEWIRNVSSLDLSRFKKKKSTSTLLLCTLFSVHHGT